MLIGSLLDVDDCVYLEFFSYFLLFVQKVINDSELFNKNRFVCSSRNWIVFKDFRILVFYIVEVKFIKYDLFVCFFFEYEFSLEGEGLLI